MQMPFAPTAYRVAQYRVSVGLLALGAVLAQTVHGFFHPPFDCPNSFSFFLIQSNPFAAFVLTASAAGIVSGGRGDNLMSWRGAATFYLPGNHAEEYSDAQAIQGPRERHAVVRSRSW